MQLGCDGVFMCQKEINVGYNKLRLLYPNELKAIKRFVYMRQ